MKTSENTDPQLLAKLEEAETKVRELHDSLNSVLNWALPPHECWSFESTKRYLRILSRAHKALEENKP
jgi:hypothetical protein